VWCLPRLNIAHCLAMARKGPWRFTSMNMTTTITSMTMLDDFLTRAALAGLGVAIAAGPLGCFVVWRRMAFFGDATAHAALLGVALALALELPVSVGVLVIALLVAIGVTQLNRRGFAMDTGLGVLSHSALALGLIAVSFISGVRVDLEAFLFGDILTVSQSDVLMVWVGALVILALLILRWTPLLLATLSPDLAHAEGFRPEREQFLLTLTLAVTVAVSIKIVGALLIGAMLVIPAAASRPLARSPEAMAVCAAIIASIAALGGLGASYQWDTPTGPTIIAVAALLFLAAQLGGRAIQR